ncbi:hypothetical protein PHYPSEUDO_002081 [Phytophthora pseudosyringae]|uniref:Uncharacterized protein n=1 Tax=Phytophthora pseudosyringae TaxID=221518 RepID=A0A8T1VUB5_9STRA|nr:hypothetical protein PHYPSEUDO_002081 [Phytophthora pseudosyringae]
MMNYQIATRIAFRSLLILHSQKSSRVPKCRSDSSTQDSVEMATDAAFLEEVSAFLNTSGLPLTPAHDESIERFIQLDPLHVSSSIDEGGVSSASTENSTTRTTKLTEKRKKEGLRKLRYQKRLKSEQETLRQVKSELSKQLEGLKQVRQRQKNSNNDGSSHDLAWREHAARQQQERFLAEMEQKQLRAAIGVQASYIEKLRRTLPEDPAAMTPDTAATSSLEENVLLRCVL